MLPDPLKVVLQACPLAPAYFSAVGSRCAITSSGKIGQVEGGRGAK